LIEELLDEFLDVVQALPADHGERLVGRPLAPFVDMRTRLVNVVENYLLRELKVKAAKMLFAFCCGNGAEAVFGKRLVRSSKVHAIHRSTVAWLGDILTVASQGAKHSVEVDRNENRAHAYNKLADGGSELACWQVFTAEIAARSGKIRLVENVSIVVIRLTNGQVKSAETMAP
jgi:hypothetical protein